MNLILMVTMSCMIMAGVYLLLSRDVFKMVMGVALLGMGVNLIVFFAGIPDTLIPAVLEPATEVLVNQAANPLPQALVLTAIVIGFALLCSALILAAVLVNQNGHHDVQLLQQSEPQTKDGKDNDKPSIMEAE